MNLSFFTPADIAQRGAAFRFPCLLALFLKRRLPAKLCVSCGSLDPNVLPSVRLSSVLFQTDCDSGLGFGQSRA